MPDFFQVLNTPVNHDLGLVLVRILAGALLGGAVAWIHGRTSRSNELGSTFHSTLVLLAILIAMVTQVIGDNVARAFSLVGALSIVRFRTVVRDTRDTAFVIFAVVAGMAAGAQDFGVAVVGLAVGGAAAFLLARLGNGHAAGSGAGSGNGNGNGANDEFWRPQHTLRVRGALALDLPALVGGQLSARVSRQRLVSLGTAKQATMKEAAWDITLVKPGTEEDLIRDLSSLDGVQEVRLDRANLEGN